MREGALLKELIYTSRPTDTLDSDGITSILNSSRQNNKIKNITGVLFYDNHHFLQIIEGEEDAIYALYRTLEADRRHHHLQILHEETIASRSFGHWVMAYNPIKENALNDPKALLDTATASDITDMVEDPRKNYGSHLFGVLMGASLQTARSI